MRFLDYFFFTGTVINCNPSWMATESEVAKNAKLYLINAPDRNGGRQARKRKPQKENQAPADGPASD